MRIRLLLFLLGVGLLVLAGLAAAHHDADTGRRVGQASSVAVIGAAVLLAPLLLERLRRPRRGGASHGSGLRGYAAFRKSARAASSRSTSSSSL